MFYTKVSTWKHRVPHRLLLTGGLTETVVLLAAVEGRQLHRGEILAAPLAVQLGSQLALPDPLPRQSLVFTQLQRWIL